MSKTFLQKLENVEVVEPEDLGQGMFYFNIKEDEKIWVKSLLNFKKNNSDLKIVAITSVKQDDGFWGGISSGVVKSYLVITEKK